MGYTTTFDGQFDLNKELDSETYEFLNKFASTRRMGRLGLDEKFGVEGEFYVDSDGFMGQDKDDSIIDYNRPPKTQPGLWCQWVPNEDGTAIIWDGGEKFYEYVPWIKYIITKILAPKGYKLTGEVTWQGEEDYDFGKIVIKDNKVTIKNGKKVYE